jgi:hypothetical protein
MGSWPSSNGNGAKVMGTTRRQIVLRLLASISMVVNLQTAAVGAEGKSGSAAVPFEWQVPENQVTIVRNSLGPYRGQESVRGDGRTLPPIVVFAGATLLVYLAKAILSLQRQLTYGGVVIDARAPTLQIRHDKALDAGAIVVVGIDGTKVFDREDSADPATLVDAIGRLSKK